MKQEIKERIELINKGIVPAGYKKTPVGICPIEWETSKLSELTTFVGGGAPSTKNRSYWEGNIPWISSSDVSDEGIYNIFVKKFINEESINNSATKLIPKDSILVVTRVGVGKLAINTVEICTSQDFTNLINIKINKKFLAFYLKELINKNLKNTQGTSIKGITTKELGNYEIFSNNILEQQKIAEILDCATRQVELQEQLVDKLKVQKKALMQKLLTPQPDWQEVKLGDICEDIYQPQTVPQKEFKNNGYKVYGANGFIGFYDKYNHKEWQVVLSCRGDCGTINKTEPESWINGNAMVLKIEENEFIDKNYFYYQCLATSFKDVIDNSGIPQITRTPLLKKNFRFIENMNVQKKLANIFINIDKRIELQQKLLEQYKLRQIALMQLLLTGIVRVG